MKPITARIKIQVFNVKTERVEIFKSIHSFIHKYNHCNFSSPKLKALRQGKLIQIHDFYVCKQNHGNCSILYRVKKERLLAIKNQKLADLKSIKIENLKQSNSAILILDNQFKIKDIWLDSVVNLALKMKIDYSTLKSQLSRFKVQRKNFYNQKARIQTQTQVINNFCYLNDY